MAPTKAIRTSAFLVLSFALAQAGPGEGFEKVGTVSGIEVIGWKAAPKVEVDPVLQALLDEGAAEFRKALVEGR